MNAAPTDDHSSYPGAEHDRLWRRLVAPADYRNPAPKARYHLAVIGAGPAGLVTAIAAAGLGANVALIEKHAMGGDCLNVGCVPSKALLEFAAHADADFDDAFAWLRLVRSRIAAHDSVERYSAAGVDVFLGSAQFVDQQTLSVGELRLQARRMVIATGARPVLPPIDGLAECRPLTNETVFDLRDRPGRLAILGAGPIGCELAQAFARLRIGVDLIDMAARVLPNESPEAGRVVADALQRNGVTLHLGADVQHVARVPAGVELRLATGTILADELVVATGRRANTDGLNLRSVGVDVDREGRINVDRYLRTGNHRIYAAGDVCSSLQFTHNADAHARICVQNALFAPTATTRGLLVPRCTYTDPEVAHIGRTRAELQSGGIAFDIHTVAFGALDRGQAQDDRDGFAEVLTTRGKDTILGATLVGRDAGEQLTGIAMAMTHGLGLGAFAKVVLPYPTRAEYLRRLGDGYNRGRLTPLARRCIAAWFRWRG